MSKQDQQMRQGNSNEPREGFILPGWRSFAGAMVTSFLFATLLAGEIDAAPPIPTTPDLGDGTDLPTRTIARFESVTPAAMRTIAREAMRANAVAKQTSEQRSTTAQLCDLYVAFRSDDRYPHHPMLQTDAGKIRSRLLKISKKMSAKLKREGIGRPEQLDQRVKAAIETTLEELNKKTSDSSAIPPNGRSIRPAKQVSDQGSTSTRRGAAASGFAGAGMDGAWELVELIQQIVRPDYWEVNGGTGTIRYFALKRVLVISATTDVHQQVGDVLRAIR